MRHEYCGVAVARHHLLYSGQGAGRRPSLRLGAPAELQAHRNFLPVAIGNSLFNEQAGFAIGMAKGVHNNA